MTFMKKHTSPPAAAFSVFLFLLILISGAFFPGIFPSLCAASGEDGFENALHLTRDQMEKGDFLSAHKALLEAEKSAFSPERKGEVRYLEGDLLIREKRLDDAGRILENLASDKDAPKDWRLKAIELWSGIYDSSGDLPQAIRILEKKLAVEGLSDQERASILHALHLRQMQAGKIADAKESLARITHLQRLPAYEKSEYFLLLASLLHREKAYHYARLECGKGIYLLKNELKKAQDREDREEAERLSKRICRLQAELIRIHSDEGQTEIAREKAGNLLSSSLPGKQEEALFHREILYSRQKEKNWPELFSELQRLLPLLDNPGDKEVLYQELLADASTEKSPEALQRMALQMEEQGLAQSPVYMDLLLALLPRIPVESLESLLNRILSAPLATAGIRDKAYDRAYDAYSMERDVDSLNKTAVRAVSDRLNGPVTKFKGSLIIASMGGVPPEKEIKDLATVFSKDGMDSKELEGAFRMMARIFTRLQQYPEAEEFLRLAALCNPAVTRNVALCRAAKDKEAPPGAGGWFLSSYLKNPELREDRFSPPDDSDGLSSSSLTEGKNETQPQQKGKSEVFFSMLYDRRGWHIFFAFPEAAAGTEGEVVFSFRTLPEREGAFCWKSDLNGNLLYSNAKDFMPSIPEAKAEIHSVSADGIRGIELCIPWILLHENLPFDGETAYPFGLTLRINGNQLLSWGGTETEPGAWGLIQWEKPSPALEREIRKDILQSAIRNFRRLAESRGLTPSGKIRDSGQDLSGEEKDFRDQVLAPLFQSWSKQIPAAPEDRQKTSFTEENLPVLYQKLAAYFLRLGPEIDRLFGEYLRRTSP